MVCTGTALLVTLFPNVSLNEAVAAYITSAIVIFNWRYRLLRQITKMDSEDVAAGMMAGILFNLVLVYLPRLIACLLLF